MSNTTSSPYSQVHGRIRVRSNHDTIETRIGERIEPQPNGCWLYRGHTNKYGMTSTRVDGKVFGFGVHRFVYETLVGDIPDGYHIHHECETPGCCNPAHLVALSPTDHYGRHAEMRAAS